MAAGVEVPPASTASSDSGVSLRPAPQPGPPGRSVGWRTVPLFLLPALALYGLFVLWPVLELIRLSLYRWSGFGAQTWIGLTNFATLWNDSQFRTSLGHSILWEVGAATVPTVLGLGLALLVSRSRLASVSLAAVFFPALLPATVVAAVWTLMYSPVSGPLDLSLGGLGLGRLAGDWLGDPHLALGSLFVAWTWSVLGIGTLIFWAGLRAIGREYLELALVEGAGPIWRLRHVVLPGLRRTGAIVVLLNAALAAQVFDLVFVTTGGGPGYATTTVPLDMYGRAFGGQAGQGAASACFQLALGLILLALVLVLLRRGEDSLDTGTPRRERSSGLLSVIVPAILVVFLLPLGWLLVAALEPGRAFALGQLNPGLDPRHWAWGNFSAVWDTGMSGAIATSALLALAVVAGTIIVATPAAFALARRMRGLWVYALLALLLLGLLQPTPVLIIPLFSWLKDLGLLDSVWGVLLPETARNLSFAVLVLWGFISQTPREVFDAAEVDGAAPWQQMLRIALPLARPALYAVGIWSFVSSWNEYLLPTLVSQDGALGTVPTLLGSMIGKYDTQYGLLAAGSLLAALPSLLIYVALRRSAAAGLTSAEGARS